MANSSSKSGKSDECGSGGVADYRDLLAHLRSSLTLLQHQQSERVRQRGRGSDGTSEGTSEAVAERVERGVRFARGIVNVTEWLEPHAKAFMAAVFAEFHACIRTARHHDLTHSLAHSRALGRSSSGVSDEDDDADDVMYEHFLQSMQFLHGAGHVVLGDCLTTVAASRAVKGKYTEAIELSGRALACRISCLGLLHPATAASHYNLGLLLRLQGDLAGSRKELRICRKITEALHGADSLEVAKVDISLGQTERISCRLDCAFLHFSLAFHHRAIELGPSHELTLRAYQLVSQTRFAYKDRLVTTMELMDRIDELGFLSFEDEDDDTDSDDIAAVMAALVTQVYALKAAMKAAGGGIVTGAQSSVSSRYITIFGDNLAFRQSHLKGMVRTAVAERIEDVRQRNIVSRRSPPHLNITTTFDNLSNLVVLTDELIEVLLPSVCQSPDAKLSPDKSRSDYIVRKHSSGGDLKNDTKGTVPNLLTSTQQTFLMARHQRRQRKKDNPSPTTVSNVKKSDMSTEVTLKSEAPTPPPKPIVPSVVIPTTVTASTLAPTIQSTLAPTIQTVTKHKKVVPAVNAKAARSNVQGSGTLEDKPSYLATAASSDVSTNANRKTKVVESDKSVAPKKVISQSPSSHTSSVTAATPPSRQLQPKASFLRVNENKHNKAFFCFPASQTASTKGEIKAVLLPPTSQRDMIISTNADGQKVTIRPTTSADILDAMHAKIYTVGIFPYLLLNDFRKIEKDEIEFTQSQAVSRKRAESAQDDLVESSTALLPSKTESDVVKQSPQPILEAPPVTLDSTTTPVNTTEESSTSGKVIPQPPPLPTSWPPKVENGVNVGGNGNGGGGGLSLPPGVGGAVSGLFSQIGAAAGAGKRKSVERLKPMAPKRKQLHWDMLDQVEGTIWTDDKDKANIDELFNEEEDIFSECAELFAATVQKSAADKKAAEKTALMNKAKSKHVAVLDGQKSQNMNIMLAKFGSRRKVSEIIHAIVSLQSSSFTLSTVNTMLDYTPASFADTGEIEGVRAVVAKDGIDKLGKAEAYLYELAKIPRVENYLRVLVLILSIEEIKENILSNAEAVIKINDEIKGSVRLKVFFRAILQVGNILNEGTKKSGAVAFKISSLSKLSQTKSNSGKTVLQYLATTLDKEMPGILDLRKDFESLEMAKHVSFPSLQLDIGKVESGLKTLTRLKEDMQARLDVLKAEQEKEDVDEGPDDEPPDDDLPEDDPPDDEKVSEDRPQGAVASAHVVKDKRTSTTKNSSQDEYVTQEILDNLLEHERAIVAMKENMCEQLSTAVTCHAELCTYLGEDAKCEPETLYGSLISFVNAVGLASAKRR